MAAKPTRPAPQKGESYTYTLYRTSTVLENARFHVATFDAVVDDTDEKNAAYNQGNCEQAQELFQNQPRVKTRFFCEKGHYRK